MRNGYGIDKWEDGREYTGMHHKDCKAGFGRMVYKDGDIYDGKYQDGQRNGVGVYIDSKTGETTKRFYKKGRVM
jgi:hypothetical protein